MIFIVILDDGDDDDDDDDDLMIQLSVDNSRDLLQNLQQCRTVDGSSEHMLSLFCCSCLLLFSWFLHRFTFSMEGFAF